MVLVVIVFIILLHLFKEHEPWCNHYLELYRELRENWERLYWDEGFSKKIAQDHANYDSAEDDDRDFSPYRFETSYYIIYFSIGYMELLVSEFFCS